MNKWNQVGETGVAKLMWTWLKGHGKLSCVFKQVGGMSLSYKLGRDSLVWGICPPELLSCPRGDSYWQETQSISQMKMDLSLTLELKQPHSLQISF